MDLVIFATQVVLGAVFLASGILKLLDSQGTVQAVIGFGMPSWLAPGVARLLPPAEVAVGVCLLMPATRLAAAVGATVLLLIFSVMVTVSLVRGRAIDCHCFGQVSRGPVSWKTVARNLALGGLSIFIVMERHLAGPITDWRWILSVTDAARVGLVISASLAGLVVLLTVLVFQLMRQNGRILLRLDALESGAHRPVPPEAAVPQAGLPVGSVAPGFELQGLHGETVTLASLLAVGLPVLLAFIDPGCGPCMALLPQLSVWQHENRDRVILVVISRGTVEQNLATTSMHQLKWVLLQRDHEVAASYRAHGTPSALLVDAGGRIASPVGAGADAIHRLVDVVTGPGLRGLSAPVPVIANGQPSRVISFDSQLPDVPLTTLGGKPATLGDVLSATAVVLFWDPRCGFCERMLGDLKAWETNRPAGSPDLLLISTGPPETNRWMGLQSAILLDDSFAAGRAIGVSGTPSAIIVDRHGKLLSSVAVGAPAVMSLLVQPDSSPTIPTGTSHTH